MAGEAYHKWIIDHGKISRDDLPNLPKNKYHSIHPDGLNYCIGIGENNGKQHGLVDIFDSNKPVLEAIVDFDGRLKKITAKEGAYTKQGEPQIQEAYKNFFEYKGQTPPGKPTLDVLSCEL